MDLHNKKKMEKRTSCIASGGSIGSVRRGAVSVRIGNILLVLFILSVTLLRSHLPPSARVINNDTHRVFTLELPPGRRYKAANREKEGNFGYVIWSSEIFSGTDLCVQRGKVQTLARELFAGDASV